MPEALIILAIIFLLFGATQVPKLARALGRSSGEFKKGLHEDKEEDQSEGETGMAHKPGADTAG
jgi:sec-independent protein translocase protein TatA